MGIGLPPPIEPQLAPIAVVQAQGPEVATVDYGTLHLHLRGLAPKDTKRLRSEVANATTLTDAVLAVGYRYYVEGWPAARLHYAVAGPQDLEISVLPGRISRVEGPERLRACFDDLPARTQLTAARLEADREVADPLAERAGQQYKMNLRADGDDAAILDIGMPSGSVPKTALLIDVNNYGNRYAGPYLAGAVLRSSFSTGQELTLGSDTSIRGLGIDGDKSQPYRRVNGGASTVTGFGVFGVEAQYVHFHPVSGDAVYDGAQISGAASWLLPLYGDFHTRLNLQSRFERTSEVIQNADHARLLGEQFNAVASSLSLLHRMHLGSQVLEMQSEVAVRKGLGPAVSTTTNANLGYFLVQPSLEFRYGVGEHWIPFIGANAQIANSALPQTQQFVIGGPGTASAYEGGSGVGDRGESYHLGVDWHGDPDSWADRHGIKPRVFAEYASTTLAENDVGTNAGRVKLADVGVSMEGRLASWANAKLSFAQPVLTQDQQPGNSPVRKTLLFDITARF